MYRHAVLVIMLLTVNQGCSQQQGMKCAGTNKKPGSTKSLTDITTNFTIKGFVGQRDPNDQTYAYVQLVNVCHVTATTVEPVEDLVPANTKVRTREFVRFTAQQPMGAITGVFGPHINTSDNPTLDPVPMMLSTYGWVYLRGTDPHVESAWVTAGGLGVDGVRKIRTDTVTTIALEILYENGLVVHRVYLIAGDPYQVKRKGQTPVPLPYYISSPTSDKVYYVQVAGPGGNLQGGDVPPNTGFLKVIGDIVTEAEIQ